MKFGLGEGRGKDPSGPRADEVSALGVRGKSVELPLVGSRPLRSSSCVKSPTDTFFLHRKPAKLAY